MAATTQSSVRVRGLRELLVALKDADTNTRREVRAILREVGGEVRDDAASLATDRFVGGNKTAAGYKVRVRQRGIAVEQSLRKTTGKRPDYGALQMRYAMIPALEGRQETLVADLREGLDRVAVIFNR